MKGVCTTLIVLFGMIVTGNYLECYKCDSPTPAKCQQDQVKLTCIGNQTKCGVRFFKITLGNVTAEKQQNDCLTKAQCDEAPIQCALIKASGGECEVSCCDTNLCNAESSGSQSQSQLKCYHCEGPEGKSYTPAQCESDQTEKTCATGKTKCGKSFQKVGSIERESRGCLSDVECTFFKGVCDAQNKADTGECEFVLPRAFATSWPSTRTTGAPIGRPCAGPQRRQRRARRYWGGSLPRPRRPGATGAQPQW